MADDMGSWTCEFCPGRKFATEEGLARHLNSVHADEESKNVSAMKPENQN